MQKFNIIESTVVGKCGMDLCEDGIYISDSIVAVIDGATSKIKKKFNSKLGGRLCMEVIKDTLSNLEPSLKPKDKLIALQESILKFKHDNNITFPMLANVIFYDAYYRCIVSYGDCRLMLNGNLLLNEKLSDVVLAEKRSKYISELLDDGSTVSELLECDLSREYILPYLLKQQSLANIEYPYLCDTPIIDRFIKSIEVNSNDTIVLATDGYPKLCDTLSESEEKLKEILAEDPLCYKVFKSTKGMYKGSISYDDRSYIKFKII